VGSFNLYWPNQGRKGFGRFLAKKKKVGGLFPQKGLGSIGIKRGLTRGWPKRLVKVKAKLVRWPWFGIGRI